MKFLALGLLVGAAVGSLVAVNALKPSSSTAWMVFSVFLLVPYLGFSIAVWRESAGRFRRAVSAILISAASMYALYDTLVLHPDPQGGIFVLMLPIFQIIAWVICLAIGAVVARRQSAAGVGSSATQG